MTHFDDHSDELMDAALAEVRSVVPVERVSAPQRPPYQRMTGWRPEKPGYWSEDPLLSWRGACPHPKCACELQYSPMNMETERACANADCPWDELCKELKPAPSPDVVVLHRRFSGLDFD